jgi:hypothetical protein
MSFAKYVFFRSLKWIGRLIAIGGVLLVFAGFAEISTAPATTIGIGIITLIAGILIGWFGEFKAKAEQIKQGIKNAKG